MAATPDELFAFLDRLGIAHATVRHPPLFTVEQSQVLHGQIAGGHFEKPVSRRQSRRLLLPRALNVLLGAHRILTVGSKPRSDLQGLRAFHRPAIERQGRLCSQFPCDDKGDERGDGTQQH
jgi:hypothetical protein